MPKTTDELVGLADQLVEEERRRADVLALTTPTISDLERALKRAKKRRDVRLDRIKRRIAALEKAAGRGARKLRQQLIPGTTKTAQLGDGVEISFRNQPDKLVVHDEAAAIAWLEQQAKSKQEKYLVTEVRLNLEALGLEQDRSFAQHVPGLELVPQSERIYLKLPSEKARLIAD